MSWKSFACVAALSALIVSPALAQPSLNWVDNGGSATLQIIPSGTGSIAAEIAVTFTDIIDAAILADAVSFDTANPGANPFTGTDTTGLYTTELASGNVFASYGSIVFASAAPVDYLTLDYSAAGTFSASSVIIAEGGAIFNPTVADLDVMVGGVFIPGDFDGSGSVGDGDLTLLLSNWGAAVPPVPSGWTGFQPTAPGVGDDELTALLGGWGTSAATAVAVPEPTTALLAVLAGVACIGCGRKS